MQLSFDIVVGVVVVAVDALDLLGDAGLFLDYGVFADGVADIAGAVVRASGLALLFVHCFGEQVEIVEAGWLLLLACRNFPSNGVKGLFFLSQKLGQLRFLVRPV